MARYSPLIEWLAVQDRSVVRASFDALERILGDPLPASARRYAPFWSIHSHLGRLLAEAGWRAVPRFAAGEVEFSRSGPVTPRAAAPVAPAKHSQPALGRPDLVLIGCVKGKRSGRHPARDLYTSALFEGRRRRAEEAGCPWYILSAMHGLVAPDEPTDSYDLELATLGAGERRAWSARVLAALDRRVGSLQGKTVEIRAGSEYRDFGLAEGLRRRGAQVAVPLEGMALGEQLAWYAGRGEAARARPASRTADSGSIVVPAGRTDPREIAGKLTRDFLDGTLHLGQRPGAPRPGWDALPEYIAAARLRRAGRNTRCDRPGRVVLRQVGMHLLREDRQPRADQLRMSALHVWSEISIHFKRLTA